MEENKKEKVRCIPLNTTIQELYGVKNDVCPLCGQKIITPINAFIDNKTIYHLTCAHEFKEKLSR